jgi:predicted enzyme related to lactoylglutathione lyase
VRERIDGALLPLLQTVRSKPASEWLVREAGRRWEVATQDEGRIAFWPPCLLDGAWTLGEDRAVPSQSRMVDWDAGDEESAITGFRIIATVARRTLTIDTSLTALASVHALARRVQRGGGTIASAMVDTKDAWQWISLCGDANGKNAKVERRPLLVPTVTGHWRGYVAAVDDADLGATLAPVLRTWLHDDDIEDVGFCSDLAELRQLGPWAEEAQPIMDRLMARLVR